jgi:CcmD family protein
MLPSPLRPANHARLLFALVAGLALASLGGRASAQPGGQPPPPSTGSAPAPAAPAPTAADSAPVPAPTAAEPAAPAAAPVAAQPAPPAPPAGAGRASYHSPMRTTCEDELAKDKDWFANLKSRLTEQINRNVHVDAARYATQNNKHVVAAYAVFWVLTAGFVLLMWRRQRALQDELGRLERELARAVKEGGGA